MRKRFRSWGVLLGLTAMFAVTWPLESARAFPDEPYSLDEASDGARTKRIHLWGELAFNFGEFVPDEQDEGADIIGISPLFGGRIQFTQHWIMELQWGFIFARVQQMDTEDKSFRVGNPYAAVHYQGSSESLSYRIGLGLTAPAATLPDSIQDNIAAVASYQRARAMRGLWQLWLWEPNAMAIVIPARLESAKPSGFLWGVELDLGVLITFKTNDNPPMMIGLAGEVGYQATDLLRVGSRFTMMILPKRNIPNSVISENTQLAVEPYMRIGRENSFFALRLLVNLDRPYGFGFDKGKIWALRTAGGVAF